MKKVRMLVSGRVQGVGFRYSTYALALEIGDIYGRVWNNDDGTVGFSLNPMTTAKWLPLLKASDKVPLSGQRSLMWM